MQSMRYPNVVVLIAHHNYQQYLGDALKSAKEQTYPNVHICVVDSSDDFSSVLPIFGDNLVNVSNDDFCSLYSKDNITLVRLHGEAKGPSHNRNVGIALTIKTADIYVVLDADDIMMPNKVSKMVSTIMEFPNEIGVVYGDTIVWNTTTNKKVREFREPYSLSRLEQECIVHSGSAITKIALQETYENTGWYDQTMRTCEDYDLWMRISEKFMIVHIPEALTVVRVQPNNSSVTVPTETWKRNWMRVQEKRNARKQS